MRDHKAPGKPPRDSLDITMKVLWRTRAEELIRFVAGDQQLQVLRPLERSTAAIRREADWVTLVEDAHGVFVQHIEFETAPDGRSLAARAYVWSAQIYASVKHLYPVRTTVLLLEDRLPDLQPIFTMEHGGIELCRFRFRILRLADLSPDDLLVEPGRAALVALSRDANEAHLLRASEIIQQQAEPDEVPELLTALYIISGRRFARERIKSLLWSQVVMESSTYQEIVSMGLEQGRQKGLQEGRQKGLQEGLQEGLQQGRQRLLRQLLLRYGSLPDFAVHQVEDADNEQLNLWSERLLLAPTVEEVFQG